MDSLVGTTQKVLIEKDNFGYTPQFARVKLKDRIEFGKIVKVKICKNNKYILNGTLEK